MTVGDVIAGHAAFYRCQGWPRDQLAVDIEDGKITQEIYKDGLPMVGKTNISTLAVVADGQALLIGGYNSTNNEDEVNKVPLLGDIPGLGSLFSHKKKSSKRWERMFVIRPRLVQVNSAPMIRDPCSNGGRPLAGRGMVRPSRRCMPMGWTGRCAWCSPDRRACCRMAASRIEPHGVMAFSRRVPGMLPGTPASSGVQAHALGFQFGAQGGAGARQAAADRAHRNGQAGGSFFIGQIIQAHHQQDAAHVLGQLRDGFFQQTQGLVLFGGVVRCQVLRGMVAERVFTDEKNIGTRARVTGSCGRG